MDLIAAPWIKNPKSPEVLAKRIEAAVCEYPHRWQFHWTCVRKNATQKPHGRLAFSIYIGPQCYIDLSVMPRVETIRNK